MSQSKTTISDKQLKQYDQLIATHSKYERKGKTTPYTAVNGRMSSFLSKTGIMGLRLSKEDRAKFIEQYSAELMQQHGHVMQEFVQVPHSLLSKSDEVSEWLQKSFAHTSALKPKPRKK